MSKIIFMGTPDFALASLKALVDEGYTVVAVYTQPPRPKGRGQQEQRSPVHEFALQHQIPVHTPLSLKEPYEQDIFKQYNADLAIVAAYGLLLPEMILNTPQLGCINIHASLLPRWRGAAPIQRAIEAGDKQTGITLMQMDVGLDTGAMLVKSAIDIKAEDTAQTLHDTLQNLGAKILLENLPKILNNQLRRMTQPLEGVTYAKKLHKEESALDFSLSAEELERKIRAFNSWPGTYTLLNQEPIKILKATVIENNHEFSTGQWFKDNNQNVFIACSQDMLHIRSVQRQNSKPVDAKEFLNGYRGDSINILT